VISQLADRSEERRSHQGVRPGVETQGLDLGTRSRSGPVAFDGIWSLMFVGSCNRVRG
jgi:hypothetical protein